jgi:hypothetical protein
MQRDEVSEIAELGKVFASQFFSPLVAAVAVIQRRTS